MLKAFQSVLFTSLQPDNSYLCYNMSREHKRLKKFFIPPFAEMFLLRIERDGLVKSLQIELFQALLSGIRSFVQL